jgi:hypothetical protein
LDASPETYFGVTPLSEQKAFDLSFGIAPRNGFPTIDFSPS